MKVSHLIVIVISAIVLSFFLSQKAREQSQPEQVQLTNEAATEFKKVNLDKNIKITTGKTIYVPVYSHIYYENTKKAINLANTLSIRNTDLETAIIIKSVNYYNSRGQLVTTYLEQPIELPPLASKDFVVPRTKTQQGASANFIVEWVAQNQVSDPVVEAVMVSAVATQGLSWVSQGEVIKTYSQIGE